MQVGWEECGYDAHKRPAIGSVALHQVCTTSLMRWLKQRMRLVVK